LSPEKEKAASWSIFGPEMVSQMAVLASLDEFNVRERPDHGPIVLNPGMGGGCRIISA